MGIGLPQQYIVLSVASPKSRDALKFPKASCFTEDSAGSSFQNNFTLPQNLATKASSSGVSSAPLRTRPSPSSTRVSQRGTYFPLSSRFDQQPWTTGATLVISHSFLANGNFFGIRAVSWRPEANRTWKSLHTA